MTLTVPIWRTLICAAVIAAAPATQFISAVGEGAGPEAVPPSPSPTLIRGVVTVHDLASGKFGMSVTVYDSRVLAATLRHGAAGTNGPLVAGLTLVPSRFRNEAYGRASGTLTPSQVTAVLADELYVDAITESGHAIRAQLQAQQPKQADAILDGSEMVPPVSSIGLGQGTFDLSGNHMVYRLQLGNIANVAGVSLHIGAPGQNGPTIYQLMGTGALWAGDIYLSLSEAALACQGMLYVKVSTAQRPAGEIRGQIVPEPRDFTASKFSGPTPDSASTSAVARLIEDPSGFLLAQVAVSGPTPTAVEVREGLPGQGGPLLFTCAPFRPGSYFGNSPLPLTASQSTAVQALQMHVVVRCPTGNIEAPIALPDLPASITEGCPGSDGRTGEGGFTYLPMPGSIASIDLLGATPNLPGALFIGVQLHPAPLSLDFLGAPGCTTSVIPTITAPMATNGFGYFAVAFSLINNHALVGLDWFGEFALLDAGANPAGITFSNAFYDGAFG